MKIQAENPLFRHSKILFSFLVVIFLSGCAGPRVASDLLLQTETTSEPLVDAGYAITTEINPDINNYEKIDNAVKESLSITLTKANLFDNSTGKFYTINTNVEIASQPAVSFGNFNGKLQILYSVFDGAGKLILKKQIYTEAGSDEWHFAAAKRHSRARAVNIARNVLEFTEYLKANL